MDTLLPAVFPALSLLCLFYLLVALCRSCKPKPAKALREFTVVFHTSQVSEITAIYAETEGRFLCFYDPTHVAVAMFAEEMVAGVTSKPA